MEVGDKVEFVELELYMGKTGEVTWKHESSLGRVHLKVRLNEMGRREIIARESDLKRICGVQSAHGEPCRSAPHLNGAHSWAVVGAES